MTDRHQRDEIDNAVVRIAAFPYHVTLFVEGVAHGTPVRAETDRCERWAWFARDALPPNRFEPTRLHFDAR